ncbi:maleylpyruvate isomerase family mycothiol-dependent enzyme [Georgenia sp. Z1344]|uniref:maleylpyruvate isomerase family mycothiol-dependent enzyme n=1 Tax=Georgenia sp. Z1344 TaxID=3416706 RepID=UPI003CEACBCF
MDTWDRNRLWQAIRTERMRLADDFADLTAEQWQTRSLSSDWTVEETLAHLTAAGSTGTLAWLRSMVGARFRTNVHNQRLLDRHKGATPAETLLLFRTTIPSQVEPTPTTWAWLGEVVVHGMDIRHPLGIASEPDHDAVEQVALSYVAKDWAVNSSSAVEGLELVATDGVFRYGEGPEVTGRTLELVMAMAGRSAYVERLEGPGVETLKERFTRAA